MCSKVMVIFLLFLVFLVGAEGFILLLRGVRGIRCPRWRIRLTHQKALCYDVLGRRLEDPPHEGDKPLAIVNRGDA
jgi:hypothetical protein